MSRLGFHGVEFDADGRVDINEARSLGEPQGEVIYQLCSNDWIDFSCGTL